MKAWELLEKNGWTQHTCARLPDGTSSLGIESLNFYGYPENCTFCAIGAIRQTYGDSQTVTEKIEKVNKTLFSDPEYTDFARTYRSTYPVVAEFNDLPTTTKEDVIALLKKAGV